MEHMFTIKSFPLIDSQFNMYVFIFLLQTF